MNKDKDYTMTFTVDFGDEKLKKKREEEYNRMISEFNKYGSFVMINDKGEILKFNE